jgi:hypothetical protein
MNGSVIGKARCVKCKHEIKGILLTGYAEPVKGIAKKWNYEVSPNQTCANCGEELHWMVGPDPHGLVDDNGEKVTLKED